MKGARVLRCWGAGVLSSMLLVAPAAGAAIEQHEGHQQPPRAGATATAPQPKAPDRVAGYEPIRCWRQVSSGAVAIGETFSLVLTCAVYDAENAQVVPDESRLNVASIQMQPFEILGGSHPADLRRGPRRFIQYDYQLRIINPDSIGRDLNIPPLTISYRIHSRVGAAAAVEGRDLSYLLPMMPIKVLSLVPADASDIRDGSPAGFGAIESLRLRSSIYWVLTLVFGGMSAAMVILALVPLARSKAVPVAARRERVSDRVVLQAAADELARVQTSAASAWDDDALRRALASVRVIAGAAIGRGVSQKPSMGPVPEGRLLIRHGVVRRAATTVASAITAKDVAVAIDAAGDVSATRRHQLDALQQTLRALTSALYAAHPARNPSAIDESVRQTIAIARDIARERRRWRG